MPESQIELIAHLARRAGFGATREELEEYGKIGYEGTVDKLLETSSPQWMSEYLIRRYHPDESSMLAGLSGLEAWLYRMITTDAPLLEKMTLFWHGIFATGYPKVLNAKPLSDQIRMFKKYAMGDFRDLLVEMARDPAMIIWLDNQQNHKDSINENFGRELLELFSMGVGNYTEDDVKECARAFTGWTIGNCEYMELRSARDSDWPYGRISWHYEFDAQDHDDGEKEFLGRKGNFNGEDIVEIICEQEATARFIARHIYHFFVADEPPVPQWPYQPPRDPEAINQIVQAYFDSNYDIRSVMKFVFNSDFFKSEDCWYEKVKSPAELVTGVMRLTESVDRPQYEHSSRQLRMQYMGQTLSNPPSVEGWDGGTTWIDTGALVERMNFASEELGKLETPGSKELFSKIAFEGNGDVEADRIIDICLKHLGTINVKDDTRSKLVDYASENGVIRVIDQEIDELGKEKIAGVVKLIASTPEFQRA
tara:strand:- start:5004 stop:6443 length:1440 start_codon:yes stop_codon:yes gene_type:complete